MTLALSKVAYLLAGIVLAPLLLAANAQACGTAVYTDPLATTHTFVAVDPYGTTPVPPPVVDEQVITHACIPLPSYAEVPYYGPYPTDRDGTVIGDVPVEAVLPTPEVIVTAAPLPVTPVINTNGGNAYITQNGNNNSVIINNNPRARHWWQPDNDPSYSDIPFTAADLLRKCPWMTPSAARNAVLYYNNDSYYLFVTRWRIYNNWVYMLDFNTACQLLVDPRQPFPTP